MALTKAPAKFHGMGSIYLPLRVSSALYLHFPRIALTAKGFLD